MATRIKIADRDAGIAEGDAGRRRPEAEMKRIARTPNPFLYIAALLGCMVFVRSLQKAGRRRAAERRDTVDDDAKPRARLSPRRADPPRPRTLRIGKPSRMGDDFAPVLPQSPSRVRRRQPAPVGAWQIAM